MELTSLPLWPSLSFTQKMHVQKSARITQSSTMNAKQNITKKTIILNCGLYICLEAKQNFSKRERSSIGALR